MSSNRVHCQNGGDCTLREWIIRQPKNEPILDMRQAWKADANLEGGTVRVGWNGRGLLLHATLPDCDIFNPVTDFNEPAFLKGDVFEIFIRPLSQDAYYEIHISPNNQQYQVRLSSKRATQNSDETLRPTIVTVPVESMVQIDRPNNRWEVFAEIPLAEICENTPTQPGSDWLVSFSRYDYTRSAEGMTFELFSTSAHKQPSFHRQQEWTLLILGHASESLG